MLIFNLNYFNSSKTLKLPFWKSTWFTLILNLSRIQLWSYSNTILHTKQWTFQDIFYKTWAWNWRYVFNFVLKMYYVIIIFLLGWYWSIRSRKRRRTLVNHSKGCQRMRYFDKWFCWTWRIVQNWKFLQMPNAKSKYKHLH